MMGLAARPAGGFEYRRAFGEGSFSRTVETGDVFQMIALRRGTCQVSCEDVPEPLFSLEAGSILCTTGQMRQRWRHGEVMTSVARPPRLDFGPLTAGRPTPDRSDSEWLVASAPLLSNPSLLGFPRAFLVTPADAAAMPCLEVLFSLIETEGASADDDSRLIISRAGELLVGVLARHLSRRRPDADGLHRLHMADPKMLRAIRLIETEVQRNWTVEALAAEVGMGRSAFAVKFRELIGDTPLSCLFKTRMRFAARMICVRDNSIARVADAIGYQSESAFSKAFLRHFGVTPGQYRAAANDVAQPLRDSRRQRAGWRGVMPPGGSEGRLSEAGAR